MSKTGRIWFEIYMVYQRSAPPAGGLAKWAPGWRWRAKSANGREIASTEDGESFTRKHDCKRSIHCLWKGLKVSGGPEIRMV